MSLFQPADSGHAFLKAGVMGLAGAGKTFTASNLAIGLVKHTQDKGLPVKNTVAFVDTENGAAWMTPRFKDAGIELMVARTRALTDLRDAIKWATDNADILIIDSITHFWTIFCDEYAVKMKRRRGLEFSDWNNVKREWRTNFTDHYLNSPLHIIMCGRQGYEYDMQVNDAGKKELIKTGVKMRAEGETGFEPSLLFQMEQEQSMENGEVQSVRRTAFVLKDRSTMLDGHTLINPTFASFLPHIETLELGGAGVAVDTKRDSAELFTQDGGNKWEQTKRLRDIALEEIEQELVRCWPGQDKDAKAAKMDMLEKLFGTRSWTAISSKSLEDLSTGRNKLWIECRGHAYGVTKAEADALDDDAAFLSGNGASEPANDPDGQNETEPAAMVAVAPADDGSATPTSASAGNPSEIAPGSSTPGANAAEADKGSPAPVSAAHKLPEEPKPTDDEKARDHQFAVFKKNVANALNRTRLMEVQTLFFKSEWYLNAHESEQEEAKQIVMTKLRALKAVA